MAINYVKFLRQYGINSLPAASSDLHPASVLCKRKKNYLQWARIDYLLDKSYEWPSRIVKAHIPSANIERRLTLHNRASVKEFGFNISGGLGRATSVIYQISEVMNEVFADPNVLVDNMDAIHRLAEKQSRMKRNNCFIAERLWYATRFDVQFEGLSHAQLEAVLEKYPVQGGVKWELVSRGKLKVSADPEVPFGFSSFWGF